MSLHTSYKIVMVGESSVGKTCLVLRYADDSFTETFLTTVGVDFKSVKREIDGKTVQLQVWDTAGQEQFRTITRSYFRGAHGILLTFDITNRLTFDHTHLWMESIKESASAGVEVILVGNKLDRAAERTVSEPEGEALAGQFGVPYFEASAKTGKNVEETFDALIRAVIARLAADPMPRTKRIMLTEVEEPGDDKQCC
jgi:small GTP-binding protein